MRNFLILLIISTICGLAIIFGITQSDNETVPQKKKTDVSVVPDIGRVQILNGCGAEGAANKVADFLRSNNFDVKFVGNADTWNYPYTMIIARTSDMSIARQVAAAMKTDKLVKIRNNDNSYDVTVYIGPDYGEKIQ